MQTKTLAYNKTFFIILFLALAAVVSVVVPFGAMADSNTVNIWWPSAGARMAGAQPFKAQVPGLEVSQYEMFWQVDNGTWNRMDNNTTDYPHKEASVDVSSWSWRGSGPYTINFIAQQNGSIISEQSEVIYIDNGLPIIVPAQQVSIPASSTPVATTTAPAIQTIQVNISPATAPVIQVMPPAPIPAPMQSSSNLYVNPDSSAATAAKSLQGSDADALKMLASQPTASWFGNWNSDLYADVKKVVTAATSAGATPVLVAYNIPERDCGGFSSGGSNNPSGYKSWIASFASAIGQSKAIVILEPDALAQISCLSTADQATRLSLLAGAVSTLKANSNTKVYVDAGHSNWIDAGTMASDLQKAGLSQADGFSLNVSNFDSTPNEVAYGQKISSQVYGKHFVIDTSRNGNGSNGQWCNPSGMSIGIKPTLQTGNSLIDAFLWVKTPGESDGACNGGPAAGNWWTSYALDLVKNAH